MSVFTQFGFVQRRHYLLLNLLEQLSNFQIKKLTLSKTIPVMSEEPKKEE